MSAAPRILLVNDDEDGLFLLEHAVAREFPEGKIIKSRTAVEALAFLEANAVDGIITDNRMPEMNGVEMVRMIRSRDLRTPILMLTGSEQMKTLALAAGVTSFVATGSWDEIRRHVRRLIESGEQG